MARPAKNDSAKAEVYVATTSGSCQLKNGEVVPFVRGITRVDAGHELLKLCPDYFEPAGDHVHYRVEQATAAPGEQRGED